MIRRPPKHETGNIVDQAGQMLANTARDLYGTGSQVITDVASADISERTAVVAPSGRHDIIAAHLIYDPHATKSVEPDSMTAQARTGVQILNALGVDDIFGFKVVKLKEFEQTEPAPRKVSVLGRFIARPTQESSALLGTVYAVEYPPPAEFIDAWSKFCDYAEQREPGMHGMPRFALFSDGDRELYTAQEYEAARKEGLFLISKSSYDHDFAGHVLGVLSLSPESNKAQSRYASERISATSEDGMTSLMRHLDVCVSTTPLSVVQPHAQGGNDVVPDPATLKRYRDGFGVDDEQAARLLAADQTYFAKLSQLLHDYSRVDHNARS